MGRSKGEVNTKKFESTSTKNVFKKLSLLIKPSSTILDESKINDQPQ